MKLKDYLSKITKNKSNGQLNTSFKKNQLKKSGLSEEEILNMKVDSKLKRIFFED